MPTQTPQQQTGALDPGAVNLTRAIRQTESGGNFQAKGQSGEYGAYQWMPSTWAMQSQKYLGQNIPIQQATPEQQNQVAYSQIKEWKDQGYNVGQIASMWNAGPGAPNAYIQGNAGINKFGAAYNTAQYAQKVATYYQQFKSQADPTNSNTLVPTAQASTGDQQQPQQNFLQQLGGFAKGALNFAAPIIPDIYNDVTGQNTKTPLQQLGDVGTTALTGASLIPGLGEAGPVEATAARLGLAGAEGGLNLGGRLALNAGLGAGFGVTGALGAGVTDPGQIAQSSLIGAGTGAALGGVGEVANNIVGKTASGGLPRSITQETLPKLSPNDVNKDVVGTIMSLKPGGVKSLFNQAEAGNQAMQSQIDPLIKESDQITTVGSSVTGEQVANQVLQSFPNSGWDASKVQAAMLRIAPDQTKVINKLFTEGLSNTEADALKKVLYQTSGISKAFRNATDPQLLADKGLGQKSALALADIVKTNIPETAPLFAKQGKYIAARNVLEKLGNQKGARALSMLDIAGAAGGFIAGGGPGAIAAGIGAKLYEQPGVKLAGANLLNRLGKSGVYTAAQHGGTLGKVAALRALLNGSGQYSQANQGIAPGASPQ